MNYETFKSVVERSGRVKLNDAQNLLESLYTDAVLSDDAIEAYTMIYDTVDFIMDKRFIGDGDDYHNIAVVCAREEDYDVACQFLEKGLIDNPESIDLLADFLSYGSKCNMKDKCKEVYNRLQKLTDRWNWRAFSFSLDYLNTIGSVADADEIYDLIQAYKKKVPDMEDPYLMEARFLKEHPDYKHAGNDSYESILEDIVSGGKKIKRTPVCDLELADYYYGTLKNIERAIQLLNKCIEDSVQTQPSVKRTYVYLLLSLCYLEWYYQLRDSVSDAKDIEDKVYKSYDNYHVASLDKYDSRVRSCRPLIECLVRESKVQYPYEDNVMA